MKNILLILITAAALFSCTAGPKANWSEFIPVNNGFK